MRDWRDLPFRDVIVSGERRGAWDCLGDVCMHVDRSMDRSVESGSRAKSMEKADPHASHVWSYKGNDTMMDSMIA